MNKYKLVFLICSIVFLHCASNMYHNYEGPERSKSEVATIISDISVRDIISIDGQEVEVDHVKFMPYAQRKTPALVPLVLLPGEHSLTASLGGSMERSLKFNVKAGQRYTLDSFGRELVLTDRDHTLIAPTPTENDAIVHSPLKGQFSPYSSYKMQLESIDPNGGGGGMVPGFAERVKPGSYTFNLYFYSTSFQSFRMNVSHDIKAGCSYLFQPMLSGGSITVMVVEKEHQL